MSTFLFHHSTTLRLTMTEVLINQYCNLVDDVNILQTFLPDIYKDFIIYMLK